MAQVNTGNFPIPNDTGANVLADINENLEALQSNNAGTSAPAVGRAHQLFVDESTSPDTLKIRGSTDNAAFITLGTIQNNMGMMPVAGGTFTGNIQSSAGSTVSPAIQIADSNTGFFKPATGQIGFATGGVERGLIGSTGLVIADNKEIRLNEDDANGYNYVGIKAPANLASSVTLTLPDSDGNPDEVLKTDGNGVTSWTSIQGVPVGCIFPYAGFTVPNGYFECDGSQKSTASYPVLSALLSNTYNYGQTPSSGNFFLPDLRGEFVRGWDHGRNKDTNRVRGSRQDTANLSHTHSVASSSISNSGGSHSHAMRGLHLQYQGNNQLTHYTPNITLGSGQTYYLGFPNTQTNTQAANTVIHMSGNIGHTISSTLSLSLNTNGHNESRPHNVALMYIIKHS